MHGHEFRLVEVGRSKFTGTVHCANGRQLLAEVKRHLMSRDVEILADGLVVAGVQSVGRVEPANDLAAAALRAWCAS